MDDFSSYPTSSLSPNSLATVRPGGETRAASAFKLLGLQLGLRNGVLRGSQCIMLWNVRVGGCSSERRSDLSMVTQPGRADNVEPFALEAEVMGE